MTDGFSAAYGTVHEWVISFYTLLPNIIVGAIVLGCFGVLAKYISRSLCRYFDRRDRTDLGRLLADFLFWALMGLGFLVMLTIVIPSLKPVDLLSSLGIGSLAIGIAFKDILQNWLSGLLILLRLPFRRGDQITVGKAEGTVMRIEPRATIIRTYDGRDIVVPNTEVYTSPVTIHTSQPVRRVEVSFTVGYAYEIRTITAIVEEALKTVDEVRDDPPPQILCWDMGDTSLGIKVRWWIHSERSQEVISRSRVVQAIKEAFDAHDIDPTDPQLIYVQRSDRAHTDRNTGQKFERSAPPPITVVPSDPEAHKPKMDSKDETLLPRR